MDPDRAPAESSSGELTVNLGDVPPYQNADAVTPLRQPLKQFMASSDELSTLMEALLYVQRNEPSIGRVILVHCYDSIGEIPTELEANHQLVDEAFPTITVDLVFIEARFEAGTLELLSSRLGVPREKFFIGCPSGMGDVDFAALAGTRIILE